MAGARVRRAGESGLLVDLDSQAAAHRLRERLLTGGVGGPVEMVVGGPVEMVVGGPVEMVVGGPVEVVVGARTVLVSLAPDQARLDEMASLLGGWAEVASAGAGSAELAASCPIGEGAAGAAEGAAEGAAAVLEVPVAYDGPDLDEVADLVGLSVEEVVRRHLAPTYTVGFVGFSPGFAYLTGLDPLLVLGRRDSPRLQVPAGSVGIAGEHTGVYPQATPGGWRVLGTTTLVAFDAGRRPPTPFVPGGRVRLVRRSAANTCVANCVGKLPYSVTNPHQFASEAASGIFVDRAGSLTTVQDLGRVGLAHLGVPRAGPVDLPSLVRANRLVGNPDGAAGLEATLVGPDLRAEVATMVALAGGSVDAKLDGAPIPMETPIALAAGSTLSVGVLRAGVRTYIAVAGGIDVAPVLGSRSTDTLAGLGPPPLRDGDRLPIGPAGTGTGPAHGGSGPVGEDRAFGTGPAGTGTGPAGTGTGPAHGGSGPVGEDRAFGTGHAGGPVVASDRGAAGGPTVARVTMGPRDDWFTAEAIAAFLGTGWRLTPACDRTGARLAGPALARTDPTRELLPEPLVEGAIQVPPNGQPIVLLANHPTTGGYPVIAVVCRADLPRIAQARPGDTIQLSPLGS